MNTFTLNEIDAAAPIPPARRMFRLLRLLAWMPMICAAIAFAEGPAPQPAERKLVGVGIALMNAGGTLLVNQLIPNSPAAASKLIHKGDRILAVAEGEEPAKPLAGKSLSDAVDMIRGKAGSTVRLTVLRANGNERDAREVLLTREGLNPGVDAPSGSESPDANAATPFELFFERLPGGQMDKLSNYRGKIVVLQFWATWSAPCDSAMADLQDAAASFKDLKDKVVFIAVSMDEGKEKPIARVKEKGWDQTLNGWSARAALNALKIRGLPTTDVIGADGRIVAENARMNQQMLEDVIKPLLK